MPLPRPTPSWHARLQSNDRNHVWKSYFPFLSSEKIKWWKAQFPNWPPKDSTPPQVIEPFGKQFFVYNAHSDIKEKCASDPRAPPLADNKMLSKSGPDLFGGLLDFSAPKWVHEQREAVMEMRRRRNNIDYSSINGTSSVNSTPSSSSTSRIVNSNKIPTSPHDLHPIEKIADPQNDYQSEPLLCITDFRQRPLCYLNKFEWEKFRKHIPLFIHELRRFKKLMPQNATEESRLAIEEQQKHFDPKENRRRHQKQDLVQKVGRASNTGGVNQEGYSGYKKGTVSGESQRLIRMQKKGKLAKPGEGSVARRILGQARRAKVSHVGMAPGSRTWKEKGSVKYDTKTYFHKTGLLARRKKVVYPPSSLILEQAGRRG